MSDYTITSDPMVSAAGVIEESVFDRYPDKTREGYFWFVKSGVPNNAEYIFVGSPNSTKSEGMGGRTIPFKCTDGQTINVQGPWWSNADSFFDSTGIDIRNTYLTFVVIARSVVREENGTVLKDVVYKDDEPTIGSYDRWNKVLKDVFSVVEDEVLVVYYKSSGGSSYARYQRSSIDEATKGNNPEA